MSSGWRQGSPAVPPELHHRPRFLIQHMMASELRSQDITADMVDVYVAGQQYGVRSLVTGDWHVVNLGDDNSAPTCDCRHFLHTRLPCKHFLAIFRHTPSMSFASLPAHYRDNTLFIVDEECTSLQYTLTSTQHTAPDVEPDIVSDHTEDSDDMVTMPSSGHLARKCRELAASIVNYTFDVDSAETLLKVKESLTEACEMLRSSSYTSGGLPLRAEAPSASRDEHDVVQETVTFTEDIVSSKLPRRRRQKPQLQPRRSARKQPAAVARKPTKWQKVDRHVHFSDGEGRKITEFFTGKPASTEPQQTTSHESESMLLKLMGMPEFIRRATAANVAKCSGRSSFMPCCRVAPKKADLTSLLPGKWLTDNIIDAYLEYLMIATRPSLRICALLSQLACKWHTEMDDKHLQGWLYPQVSLCSFQLLFIPICTSAGHRGPYGSHWVLLVADVPQRQVYVLNSVRDDATCLRYANLFVKYMHIRSANTEPQLHDWTIRNTQSGLQTDGSSCGVFTAMNADAVCSGVDPLALTNREAVRYRDVMFTRIEEVMHSNKCAAVKCMHSDNNNNGIVQWAQCDNCMLWFHFACEQLLDKPVSMWYCTFCMSATTGH